MLNNKAQEQLEKLVEAFRTGQIGEVIHRTVISPVDVPCSRWSLCNRVIVALSGTDDARGYRQWEEVGRHVKKGAKGIYILIPWVCATEGEEEGADKDTTRGLRGFVAKAVFAYEDTEGEEIEQPVVEPPQLPPLYEVAERFGLRVKYKSFDGNRFGYYDPEGGEIVLMTHQNKTFWHELAHAAHQRIKGTLKRGSDPKQEAVAELTATVIAGLYGSDWSGNCWQYVQVYSENPLGLCLSVLSDTGHVLNEILNPEVTTEATAVASSA